MSGGGNRHPDQDGTLGPGLCTWPKKCSNDQRNLQTWNFQCLLFLICSPCNLVQVLQADSHPQCREQNWQEEQHQGNLCSSVALNKGRLFNWAETKPVKSASNSLCGWHPPTSHKGNIVFGESESTARLPDVNWSLMMRSETGIWTGFAKQSVEMYLSVGIPLWDDLEICTSGWGPGGQRCYCYKMRRWYLI